MRTATDTMSSVSDAVGTMKDRIEELTGQGRRKRRRRGGVLATTIVLALVAYGMWSSRRATASDVPAS